MKGTPKTLKQAIENGLSDASIEAHVRDFLAQHFNAAMLTAPTPEESERLEALFKQITATESPKFPSEEEEEVEEAA